MSAKSGVANWATVPGSHDAHIATMTASPKLSALLAWAVPFWIRVGNKMAEPPQQSRTKPAKMAKMIRTGFFMPMHDATCEPENLRRNGWI